MLRILRAGIVALLAISANAQFPLAPADAQKVSDSIDRLATSRVQRGDQLACEVQPVKPFLDFALRFDAGYFVRCPLQQFAGHEAGLVTFLRVRPEHGAAVVLVERYRIPAMPADLHSKVNGRRFTSLAEFSGAFAIGEGEYAVDLLVADDHDRIFHKNWKAKAALRGEEKRALVTMKPDSAAGLGVPVWKPDAVEREAGVRLTVLLDAAPIDPYALKLRAWDRAFLLDSLSSLLHHISPSSTRVVAFNLEQQKEVFRKDGFGRADFRRLAESLRELELGTVSYRVLNRQQGWSELLADLVARETGAAADGDVVIFLGPNTRIAQKIPEQMVRTGKETGARLFYFEYFPHPGAEFPDAIQRLTSMLNGTTLKIHSPGDLAEAIQKMREKLGRSGAEARPPE